MVKVKKAQFRTIYWNGWIWRKRILISFFFIGMEMKISEIVCANRLCKSFYSVKLQQQKRTYRSNKSYKTMKLTINKLKR